MTDQASIPPDAITPLRDNDVLFGRGKGPQYHPGNVAFRTLVDSRKAEYWSEDQAYGEKMQLAGEVYDTIVTPTASGGQLGGRFLKQTDDMEAVRAEIHAGRSVTMYGAKYYVEVPRRLAVDKCKMALRQKGTAAEQREARRRKRLSLPGGASVGSYQNAAAAASTVGHNIDYGRPEQISSAVMGGMSSFPEAVMMGGMSSFPAVHVSSSLPAPSVSTAGSAAAAAATAPSSLDLDSLQLDADLQLPLHGPSQQQHPVQHINDVLVAAALEAAAQAVAAAPQASAAAHPETIASNPQGLSSGLLNANEYNDGGASNLHNFSSQSFEPFPFEHVHHPEDSIGSTRTTTAWDESQELSLGSQSQQQRDMTSLIETALVSIQMYRSALEATAGFDANALGRILYQVFVDAREDSGTTHPNMDRRNEQTTSATDSNAVGGENTEPAKRERRNTGSYQSLVSLGYPVPLSNLLGCLLNQTPSEAIYSSSVEVESDLRELLQGQGSDGEEEQAQHEDDGQLHFIENRIFGRDEELQVLLSAYDRVVRDGNERRSFVTISGYSGTGKTSMVNQLGSRLLADKASLVKCSFSAPGQSMSALFQAFDDYCRNVSGGDGRDSFDGIRRDVGEALGDRSGILSGCLPSLRSLLGEKTDAPTTRAETKEEEMNQILFYFIKFVRAISGPDHPVVIVLDDIQWCDESCLEVVRMLLRDTEIASALFIGCYRDEEVGNDHRFSDLFGELAMEASLPMSSITLKNLDSDGVNALISSVLRLNPRYTRPLAEVLQRKTQGNPMFVRQLLRSMADDGLLTFSVIDRRWQWNIQAISSTPIASNAVSLTIGMMRTYDRGVQNLLRLSALLGTTFKQEILERLFLLYEYGSKPDVALGIERAVAGGVIADGGCGLLRFSHDQLYQAACALTPSSELALAHLDIGRRLLKSVGEDINELGSNLAGIIVDQYNEGSSLITDRVEKLQLAELNLVAGEAALNSASFLQAAIYLLRGCGLIRTDDWESHYSVCLRLFTFCGEAQLTQGMADGAVTAANEVLKHGRSFHDKLPAHQALLTAFTILGDQHDAINHGISVLKDLGEDFPVDADGQQAASKTELMRICGVLQSKSLDEIVSQTSIESDSAKILSMQLLMVVTRITYLNDPTLMLLLVFRMVSKSMSSGLTAEASFAFAALSFALCGLGKYELSSFCARIASALLQKFSQKYSHIVQLLLNCSILPYSQPQQACVEQLHAAYEDGMAVGAVEWALVNLTRSLQASLFAPDPNSTLEDYLKRIVKANGRFVSFKHSAFILYNKYLLRAVPSLLSNDETSDPLSSLTLNEEILSEFPIKTRTHVMRRSITLRIWFSRLFGLYEGAKELVDKFQSIVAHNPFAPSFDTINEYFYVGLIAFDLQRKDDADKEYWDALGADVIEKFKEWVEIGCDWNFESKMQMLVAERAYTNNQFGIAEVSYEEAVIAAKQHGFIHEEALANELAGTFYCERGDISGGRSYLQKSVVLFTRWGAHRKAIHVCSVLNKYHSYA